MLSVTGISKKFGSFAALDLLNFTVSNGDILGLLGPNGAGKTTTMRIMSGYLTADSGDVLLDDISVTDNPVLAQKLIGYLPENNPLYKDMSVSEMLSYSANLKGLTPDEYKSNLDFVVKSVHISDVFYKPIKDLSKGYRQRVGIAVALLHKPRVLILDEPTEGLDPNQRAEIRSLIRELSADRTVVISTHVMQEVEALCKRMVLINRGKVVADGLVDDIKKGFHADSAFTVAIEGKNVKELLAGSIKIKSETLFSSENSRYKAKLLVDKTTSVQPVVSRLARDNNWIIWDLHQENVLLEDIFKELTS